MKLLQILNAIKIGALVAKSLTTGKVASTLETIERGADIAKAVKKAIKK